MRRRTGHVVFGGIAILCAVIAGYQGVRLAQARGVNAAIASSYFAVLDKKSSLSRPAIEGSGSAKDKEPSNAGRLESAVPEAQFAHALALSHGTDPEIALKAYKTIAQGKRTDLRIAALYNIGNLHMREAARKSADDPTQLLPLVELAKQSYRDVLRAQPDNWDARYNLERALQLAPEVEDVAVEEEETEAPEEHVSSTLQGAKMDLP